MKILEKLFNHEKLTAEEARSVLIDISENKYNEAQIAVFMGVYMMRTISVEELRGFRDALLELCKPINFGSIQSTDMCGTGGDGKNTFNISTSSAFVVAGAGYKVTKHGNYGVSSICGSSNVLEQIGYNFTSDTDVLRTQLDKTNLCFIHAPLFHPAMKAVAPVRRQLGLKTFFNMLGPLVNPARPTHQAVGVFSVELARLYQFLLEKENINYNILHGLDGYDEVSLTSDTLRINKNDTTIINSKDFSMPSNTSESIHGGHTISEAADILIAILSNEGTTSQENVVTANAAIAIQGFENEKTLEECTLIAKEAIQSGAAKKVLTDILNIN
jgi:anthranilate phosphoribosyltransferase